MKYYDSNEALESRCKQDNSKGYYIPEKEVIKWIDNYFDEYDESEVFWKVPPEK